MCNIQSFHIELADKLCDDPAVDAYYDLENARDHMDSRENWDSKKGWLALSRAQEALADVTPTSLCGVQRKLEVHAEWLAAVEESEDGDWLSLNRIDFDLLARNQETLMDGIAKLKG